MPRRKHLTPRYRLERNDRGIWEVRWTQDGRSRRKSSGTRDEDEGYRFKEAFAAERGGAPDSPTVAQIIEAYWEEHGRHTLSAYNLGLRLDRVKAYFGHLEPWQINSLVTNGFHVKRRKAGIGDGTLNLECRALATALEWARKENWIPYAPYIKRPSAPEPRERFLTREEARALMEAVREPHTLVFIVIGLNTAARKGAILDLTWDRVHFERRLVDFRNPERGRRQKPRAVVPMNETLFEVLSEAHKAARTDWVVEYGGSRVRCIDHSFKNTAKRAGLGTLHPHVLRHTVISWQGQRGVKIDETSDVFQISPQIIRRVYRHFDPEWGRDAVRALEG